MVYDKSILNFRRHLSYSSNGMDRQAVDFLLAKLQGRPASGGEVTGKGGAGQSSASAGPSPVEGKGGKGGAKGAPGKMSGGGGANERMIDILAESGT
jgi:hypothetical protein